jgi:hypothetical protein
VARRERSCSNARSIQQNADSQSFRQIIDAIGAAGLRSRGSMVALTTRWKNDAANSSQVGNSAVAANASPPQYRLQH